LEIVFYSILVIFFEETSLNQFRIPNYPSILSKELLDETFLKSSFAAKNTVLQHFAATQSFLEKETILIQFIMTNYP